ncbi:MAG: GNAT family N-acetyltransferase [Pseudomonadota bacterium]
MAGKVSVRSATRNDLPTLLDFEQGIIEAERPYDHTLKPDPISYYDIGQLIDSDDAEVAVLELDGEVAASGYAQKRRSSTYRSPDQYAFLGFMYVRPEDRGKGLNKALLDHLLEWARSKNLTEIRLTVYPENEPAVRAYEKAGFAPFLLDMRLNLDE